MTLRKVVNTSCELKTKDLRHELRYMKYCKRNKVKQGYSIFARKENAISIQSWQDLYKKHSLNDITVSFLNLLLLTLELI